MPARRSRSKPLRVDKLCRLLYRGQHGDSRLQDVETCLFTQRDKVVALVGGRLSCLDSSIDRRLDAGEFERLDTGDVALQLGDRVYRVASVAVAGNPRVSRILFIEKRV